MNRKSFTTLFWIALTSGIFFFIINPQKSITTLLLTLLISALYTFAIATANTVVNDYLNRRFPWTERKKSEIVFGIILIVITNSAVVLFCNYINFIIVQGEDSANFFRRDMAYTNWFMINFALMISAFLHARSFMTDLKRTSRKEVVEQKIIAKSANAQFETLKNQLDPHFLFNSLNVLSALIDESPNQAQRFTSSMSKIYRYVLDEKDKELVTVEEEIDFAKTYCELLKTRFEDSVNFEFEIDENLKTHFVVPLSLQLLLENAIKHNFATSSKPLNIRIFSENGFLCIENNLQQREIVKEREGIGLSNIVQRYSLITDRNVFIEKSEEHFKVKVPVLSQKITAMNTQNDTEMMAYEKAAKRVEKLKDFYGNLISYCIFIPFLFYINWQTSPNYWWAFWPMFGWGIGVAVHAIQTFGIGNDWEERQIRKYMEKQESDNRKWR